MSQECRRCHVIKPLSEFFFRSDAQDYRRTCKQCCREQKQARIEANRERHLERERVRARRQRRLKPEINRRAHAKWKATHPERAKALQARYRANGGAERTRQWFMENRERYNAYMRDWNATRRAKTNIDDLIRLVRSMLPPNLTAEMREDIMQSVLISVLSGECLLSDLHTEIRRHIAEHNRSTANTFKFKSLDAPIHEDGLTLGDVLIG